MLDFRLFDKSTCPGEGWRWSTTLNKWRRDPAPFRKMRAGIHIALGLLVGYITLGDWQTLGILTLVFLAYERWESQVIFDEAYPDVGGYLTGLIILLGLDKIYQEGYLSFIPGL